MTIIKLSEQDIYHYRRVAIWNVQTCRKSLIKAIAAHGKGYVVEMWKQELDAAKRNATLARKLHRLLR